MLSFGELTLIGKLGGTLFKPERHRLIEGNEWVASLQRRLVQNGYLSIAHRVFMYHHEIEDTMVLAFWRVNKDDGQGFLIMQELVVLRCLPGEEKSSLRRWLGNEEKTPTFEEIEPMFRPARETILQCQQVLREEDARLRKQAETDNIARGESNRYLKQQGMGGIPAAVPFAAGDSEDFAGALKQKVTY